MAWRRLPIGAAPPYAIEHLHDIHGFHERSLLCSARSPGSTQYGWSADGKTPPQLESAEMLCARLHGSSLLFIGDSLSLQIFDSFRARRRQSIFADGLTSARTKCMAVQPNPCEGDASDRLCDGLCTGGVTHQQSAMYASCDNGGGTVFIAQAYRWVMASTFTSSDPLRGAGCADRIRREPKAFGLFVVPADHLHRMVREAARHTTRNHGHHGGNGTAGGMTRASHRVVLVLNQFAHIHNC